MRQQSRDVCGTAHMQGGEGEIRREQRDARPGDDRVVQQFGVVHEARHGERADTHPHGEYAEHEGDDVAVGMQQVARQCGEGGEHCGPQRPEPAYGEAGEVDRSVYIGQAQQDCRLPPQIPARLHPRRRDGRAGDEPGGGDARQGDGDAREGRHGPAMRQEHQNPARQRAEDDAGEGSGLDQPIARHQRLAGEEIRQNPVFQR